MSVYKSPQATFAFKFVVGNEAHREPGSGVAAASNCDASFDFTLLDTEFVEGLLGPREAPVGCRGLSEESRIRGRKNRYFSDNSVFEPKPPSLSTTLRL